MNPHAAAFSSLIGKHATNQYKPPAPSNPKPNPSIPQREYNPSISLNSSLPSSTSTPSYVQTNSNHYYYNQILTSASVQPSPPSYPYPSSSQRIAPHTSYLYGPPQPPSQYSPQQMFQYPLPSLSHVGIVTRNNSENNPTTNSSFGHILSEYTQGRYESNEKNSYNSQHYCEVCNKYFPNNSSLTSHLQTHEKCTFSDCEFEGTKKLVAAHHHSVHGEYSGKGYKQINVEGQTFCVLLGTDPEEVKDWRNDRKKRFPTAANISKKVEESSLLRKSGGLLTSYQKKVSATETEANETHQKDGKISSRKITKNEIICKFFAKSRRCNSGANCKFSHDLRSKPCNSFTTQGHCSKGDKCCFLHNSFECVVKEDTVATGSEIASPPTPYVCAVGPDERAVDSGMTSPCVETQVPLELCIAPNETDISMTATQAATLSAASSQPLKRNATNMGANQPHLKKSRKMPKQNEPKLQKLFSENLLKKLLNDSILEEENLALQCIHYLVNSCMPQSE